MYVSQGSQLILWSSRHINVKTTTARKFKPLYNPNPWNIYILHKQKFVYHHIKILKNYVYHNFFLWREKQARNTVTMPIKGVTLVEAWEWGWRGVGEGKLTYDCIPSWHAGWWCSSSSSLHLQSKRVCLHPAVSSPLKLNPLWRRRSERAVPFSPGNIIVLENEKLYLKSCR